MDLFKNFDDDEEMQLPERDNKFKGKRPPNDDLPTHKVKKQRGYQNILT
jgi:hypothetical protein